MVDLNTWPDNNVARENRRFTHERATGPAQLHDALPSFFSIAAVVPRDVVADDPEFLAQI